MKENLEMTHFETLTNEQQREEKRIYSDFILSFDEAINDSGGSQFFATIYMKVCENEAEQLKLMMNFVADVCAEQNLPKNKLYKISTACNWTLFRELTGEKTEIIDAINGKFYFGQRDDLSALEKQIMERWGFGVDYKLDTEMLEWMKEQQKLMKAKQEAAYGRSSSYENGC